VTAPVAIITPVSQKFWDKFKDSHIRTIAGLSPQPEQIIVVSDAKLDLPEGWMLVDAPSTIGGMGSVALACNKGFESASTEWVMYKPVDDLMDSNFFDGMPYGGDAVNVMGRWAKGYCYGTPEQFHDLLDLDRNGMPGWILMRKKTAMAIPFRPIWFDDWIFWIDFRAKGLQVVFDGRCVWTWCVNQDSFSHGSAGVPVEAIEQTRLLRQMHKSGKVRFRAEWPPVFEVG